jgi:putative mycofactocin binding protein MftB
VSRPESPVELDARYRLNPSVSLRRERFGALAYHFGNRRLSFLKHPDLVRVVESFDGTCSVRDAFARVGVEERRWPAFVRALGTLRASEMLDVA